MYPRSPYLCLNPYLYLGIIGWWCWWWRWVWWTILGAKGLTRKVRCRFCIEFLEAAIVDDEILEAIPMKLSSMLQEPEHRGTIIYVLSAKYGSCKIDPLISKSLSMFRLYMYCLLIFHKSKQWLTLRCGIRFWWWWW